MFVSQTFVVTDRSLNAIDLKNMKVLISLYNEWKHVTGLDVCPAELYSNNEQHITGDVALAFQQYLRMSDDRKFLDHERGAEAIQNIADFWASRVSLNKSTNLYEINGKTFCIDDSLHRV